MYTFNRTVFLNATVNIPLPIIADEYLASTRELNSIWKNKWIYLRASFDYPITFYLLKEDPAALVGGIGLYNGDFDAPSYIDPQDHKIMAMPGATVGVEIQFLSFMSLEINYQVSMGDTRDNMFINMASGAELKFPIKFENIVLSPYGTASYFLKNSPIFTPGFPLYVFGAGVQVSAKGGKNGAFFVDIKYMIALDDAIMTNPYLDLDEGQLAPKPDVIHYNRAYIGVGIGYKIGLLNRK
jgi:hypothetical protein